MAKTAQERGDQLLVSKGGFALDCYVCDRRGVRISSEIVPSEDQVIFSLYSDLRLKHNGKMLNSSTKVSELDAEVEYRVLHLGR